VKTNSINAVISIVMTASILAGPIIVVMERALLALLSKNYDNKGAREDAIKKAKSKLRGGKRIHLEPPKQRPVTPEQTYREMVETMGSSSAVLLAFLQYLNKEAAVQSSSSLSSSLRAALIALETKMTSILPAKKVQPSSSLSWANPQQQSTRASSGASSSIQRRPSALSVVPLPPSILSPQRVASSPSVSSALKVSSSPQFWSISMSNNITTNTTVTAATRANHDNDDDDDYHNHSTSVLVDKVCIMLATLFEKAKLENGIIRYHHQHHHYNEQHHHHN
jgi:hypothetical protein